MKRISKSLVAIAAVVFSAQAATIVQNHPGSLPFTEKGTLTDQSSVLEQMFTLTTPAALRITTISYADGGFQTNLQLYDSAGNFIKGSMPGGMPDLMTGLIGDSVLMTSTLTAGTYTVALTDWLLTQSLGATNLSDGFTFNLGDGTTFIDANGNQRSGAYALNVQAQAVPEPATIWLAAPVLAWVGARARKRAKRIQ
jgi:hypothetical protein